MRVILFLLLFNTVSAFSQIVSFKADTLFMDNSIFPINDNIYYKLNLYDSTMITNSTYEVLRKISYRIENGVIIVNDEIEFHILKNRIKLVHLNSKKIEDFYFTGNYNVIYESKQ
jgi:hypothetical protein